MEAADSRRVAAVEGRAVAAAAVPQAVVAAAAAVAAAAVAAAAVVKRRNTWRSTGIIPLEEDDARSVSWRQLDTVVLYLVQTQVLKRERYHDWLVEPY